MQTVTSIPNLQLVKLTHIAMLTAVQGLTVEAPGGTVTVPATYSRPEAWMEKRESPSICVNCVEIKHDGTRMTTAKFYAKKAGGVGEILEKQYWLPVNYFYDIRFIVPYGENKISLEEQIFKRLRPMGFHSYLTIASGDFHAYLPYELVTSKEAFARFGETKENREFEQFMRYRVSGWIDVYDTVEIPVILKVALEFNTPGGAHEEISVTENSITRG